MEEAKDEVLTKDSSLRVTKEMDFGTSKGQLRVYNNNVTPKEYEEYPKVTITVAEGIEKVSIRHNQDNNPRARGFRRIRLFSSGGRTNEHCLRHVRQDS